MNKIWHKIISRSVVYSGINYLCSLSTHRKVFLVGYHSISKPENTENLYGNLYKDLSITKVDFEAQIKYLLKNGHTFVRLADLSNLSTDIFKPTIIYFDDGFKDNLINAAPILDKYGLSAALFLSTDLIDRKRTLWTIKMRYLLSKQNLSADSVEKIKNNFKLKTEQEVEDYLSELGQSKNLEVLPEDFPIFLSWDDVRDLTGRGWEIGSHGVSHRKLTSLNPVELSLELENSKKNIEDNLGVKVDAISYPYGRTNAFVREQAKKACYNLGISTVSGFNDNDSINKDFIELKKIAPRTWESLTDFKFRLYGRNYLK